MTTPEDTFYAPDAVEGFPYSLTLPDVLSGAGMQRCRPIVTGESDDQPSA